MNPDLVYLAQTETTAGFLSQSAQALIQTKNRPSGKAFLMSVFALVMAFPSIELIIVDNV